MDKDRQIALGWARKRYEQASDAEKGHWEFIFPELKESEDERARKAALEGIEYLECELGWDAIGDTDILDVKEYLGRQKEQKPEHFELKSGKWYICHRAYCCRADHLTVKEGERFMCEEDGVVKGFVIKEPEKYFKECSAPAPMEDEQKPAGWSEEDEEMITQICANLEYLVKEAGIDTKLKEKLEERIKWMKRLKSLSPQPKAELTLLDENIINATVAFVEQNNHFNCWCGIDKHTVIKALRSLKPHWKPSEEQMNALKVSSEYEPCMKNREYLKSLYNDLKSL